MYGLGHTTSVLYDMFRGKEPSVPRAEGTFVNASNGEILSAGDVAARLESPISPGAQAEIRQTVEEVTGEPLSINRLVEVAKSGEVESRTERVALGNGVALELTTHGSGENIVVDEAVIHTDDHNIGVKGSEVTVDGKPADSNTIEWVRGLINHISEEPKPEESPEIDETTSD